jgi:hypothetical protein
LLSPRKLYYCRDQLYLHCDHGIASEDRLVDGSKAPYGLDGLNSLAHSDRHRAQDFAKEASGYWYRYLISQGYSRCDTTYERDRLVAVSGLARRVGSVVKSRYLAGLWQSTVIQGLPWEAGPVTENPIHTKTSDTPSWSWATQK